MNWWGSGYFYIYILTWWAAVHGVAKSQTRLSDFTFTFCFHALEKEMATHSSVLAWRIPGTGEPGGLPLMGLHRVGHDWSDLAAAAAANSWGNLLFSHSVVSDSLPPHRLQHARLPCPSLSPGVCSNSCPWSWWCHPTISSSEGIIELDYYHFTVPVGLMDTVMIVNSC